MVELILILFFVFFPVIILELCYRFKILDKLGSILIAYIFGLLVGNLGILPNNFDSTQELLTTLTIPLALPLLLFSLDVKSWLNIAGKSLLSMLLAFVALIVIVVAGFYIFNPGDHEFWKISGMLIGVYTGGTPNLASLQLALEVDPNTYVMTHTFDMLLSAIFLLFLISVGKVAFAYVLPKFKISGEAPNNSSNVEDAVPFYRSVKKHEAKNLLLSFVAALLILAIGGGLSEIVPKNISMLVAILSITTLGIAASFIKKLKESKHSFDLGMYFILVFSLVVASMADISSFTTFSTHLFYYISFAVFGTLILHVLLSALFKIDRDTVIITSTAFICSPPFVPMIAGVLKNKQIIISGLTIGIIGYAVGNYLGISIAYFLK
jgi:uncharacterized membrane protein